MALTQIPPSANFFYAENVIGQAIFHEYAGGIG